MGSTSSQSCQTLDIFSLLRSSNAAIDRCRSSRRADFLKARKDQLPWSNMAIYRYPSSRRAGFHRGGMRAENLFSPPPPTASPRSFRRKQSLRSTVDACQPRWNNMMRRTNIVVTRFRVCRIFVLGPRILSSYASSHDAKLT